MALLGGCPPHRVSICNCGNHRIFPSLGVRVIRWLVSPLIRVCTWTITLGYLSKTLVSLILAF
eukprot:TRINITY_DN11515_c0_g1_i1.p2 TRINITY_DN11515_c0_g1~~TRINITY_DN11515_c0_g1_i1.p2  ORF type:complete len:63 (-),score=3.09 TRINITY_DN11515_c0_g1_i1:57-245(-)